MFFIEFTLYVSFLLVVVSLQNGLGVIWLSFRLFIPAANKKSVITIKAILIYLYLILLIFLPVFHDGKLWGCNSPIADVTVIDSLGPGCWNIALHIDFLNAGGKFRESLITKICIYIYNI